MNWIKKTYKRFFQLPSRTTVVIFSVLFCTLLFYALHKTEVVLSIGLSISLVLASLLVAMPKFGRATFATLSLVTYPIGFVVSFIILAVIYYVILTPIGLMRNRSFTSGWSKSEATIDKTKLYE